MTPRVWALHDGRIGIRNQVLGLAERLGWGFEEKRAELARHWLRFVPPGLLTPEKLVSAESDALTPPWPELVIGCGHQGAVIALSIKAASGERSFLVHIQDPRVGRSRFDLLVVPEHDPARGGNVVVTRGAVHRVTPELLHAAAERLGPSYADLPRPRVAVLIGGNNRHYRLGPERLASFADELAHLSRETGAGLMVTPSRRTGAAGERVLRERLASVPARIWDGTGENPYFAFLALADAIVVTCDSVSMTTEAASTGKPVMVLDLPGGSAKFRRFHEGFRKAGITRPFQGRLESWTYGAVDDTAKAAEEIRRRVGAPALRAAE
jgi:mitochondrial fission protein ELM1